MKRVAWLFLALCGPGCSHQVAGVLGSHDAKIWVVRTDYRGVQEVYRCVDDGGEPVCKHAPLKE
jgi:hypothetical protein